MNDVVKPIRSEADYNAALAELEWLWGSQEGTPEGDRLDVLATLIEAYEAQHYLMDPPDPIDAITFRMEQQGMSENDLQAIIGSGSSARKILNREQELSLDIIRRLHNRLGIAAEVLIRPVRTGAA